MTRPAANDNDPFAGLPLFATDKQIATAIVGRDRAEHWLKNVLPGLRGFPSIDGLHKGRALPLIRKYYGAYLGLSDDVGVTRAFDEEENLDVWKKSKRRA